MAFIADSEGALRLFQRIRRNLPNLTEEMNTLIDVLSVGDVSFSLDKALADYWSAKRCRGATYLHPHYPFNELPHGAEKSA